MFLSTVHAASVISITEQDMMKMGRPLDYVKYPADITSVSDVLREEL
jgi:hypothetical protein